MSKYKGLFTFDADSHRFVPIGQSDEIVVVDDTDYVSTEPLIKDEKIRKAVRAWAEANDVKKVTIEKDFSTYAFYPTDTDRVSISVWTEPSLSNLSKDKTYTITELCGEEG